jgi:signal transduction histidine kinase
MVPVTGVASGSVLGVWDRIAFHPADCGGFDALDRSFLDTLVRLASGLLERARQDEGVRSLQRERQELERQLRRLERSYASAELTSRALKEARNPVASIAAFARRAQKEQPDGETSGGDYLHVIVRESERLERWLETAARAAAPEPGGMAMTELNGLIQDALQGAGERLVRRRVRLLKRLATDLPQLLLDRERIQRAVTNVLEQALDAVGVGGRIRVETRRAGTHAVIEIAHDGHASTGERFEQMLATFAAGRSPGSLGLALAQRVVQEHGGEVRVRGEGEWGAILTVSLPIRDNTDRRREAGDRRATHIDRRRRSPAA